MTLEANMPERQRRRRSPLVPQRSCNADGEPDEGSSSVARAFRQIAAANSACARAAPTSFSFNRYRSHGSLDESSALGRSVGQRQHLGEVQQAGRFPVQDVRSVEESQGLLGELARPRRTARVRASTFACTVRATTGSATSSGGRIEPARPARVSICLGDSAAAVQDVRQVRLRGSPGRRALPMRSQCRAVRLEQLLRTGLVRREQLDIRLDLPASDLRARTLADLREQRACLQQLLDGHDRSPPASPGVRRDTRARSPER